MNVASKKDTKQPSKYHKSGSYVSCTKTSIALWKGHKHLSCYSLTILLVLLTIAEETEKKDLFMNQTSLCQEIY